MALGAVCACAGISCADDALLATFRQPPPAARPEVWWHWMNGNVSRAGIVADLDAMAAVGLGGVILDLGDVKNLATVTVNGRTYPPLWRPPFRVDVTDAWSVTNEIAVRVATLWPNRLIGDEQLPPDCDWRGGSLAKIPTWVERGERSPTGRHTFTTWRHWKKDETLLPSGLLGPVRQLTLAQ